MNTAQFIILTILFSIGISCQEYNLLIELKKKQCNKSKFLQIVAIICLTAVYGLGVIVAFTGL